MKRCDTCLHWEQFNGSPDDRYGECRKNPPRMSGMLLFYRSQFFSSMSARTQNQSTLWPVTGQDEYCDGHELPDN